MNNQGQWGAATNIEGFRLLLQQQRQKPIVYLTKKIDGKYIHEAASQEWIDNYITTRMAPLVKNNEM